MEHYICTGGCGGVSKNPGVCQDTTCPSHMKPLHLCECQSSEHQEKLNPKTLPEDSGEEIM